MLKPPTTAGQGFYDNPKSTACMYVDPNHFREWKEPPEYVTVAIYGNEQQKKARIRRLNKIVSQWK